MPSKDNEDMDAKQIIAARGYSLQEVKFKDKESKDCIALLLMRKSEVEKFEREYKKGEVNLKKFGSLIYSAYGNKTPEWVDKFVDEFFE